jgi:hypothetical protein
MARKQRRPAATAHRLLTPLHGQCWECGCPLWFAYQNTRTVTMLAGLVHLTLQIRRCPNPSCALYHRPCRPEEEGALVLPKGEFGLDVIAWVGALRYREHRSVPEIHQALQRRGVRIAERTVTHLVHRYEELVALRLQDQARLRERLARQGRVLLALDGLQPDVGHEVLWVLRDCLSGEVLLARSLLSATQEDLAGLLQEVQRALPVPIRGVVSDGQHSIRRAVRAALPGVPHQLCHFHYLREAAKPVYEADRHAKKELQKQVRGVRPLERQLEARTDPAAQAVRAYCLAVRSALTDDGLPPLCASGLRLQDRLQAIQASIARVTAKRGTWWSWGGWRACSPAAWPPRLTCGRRFAPPIAGCTRPPTCSPTRSSSVSNTSAERTAGSWPRCRGSAPRPAPWRRRSGSSSK